MIRDYCQEDLQTLREIHASQGFDYELPDLSSPLVLVKKVREENGKVVGAMFLRITAEAFLLVQGSPVAKGRSLEELQPEVDRTAWNEGLAEYVCVVPPEIVKDFEPVLLRRGFEKAREWPLFQRSLEG